MTKLKRISEARQCRAARALLNWTQADLADSAGIAKSTVSAYERAGIGRETYGEVMIWRALAAAGVTRAEDGGIIMEKEEVE